MSHVWLSDNYKANEVLLELMLNITVYGKSTAIACAI